MPGVAQLPAVREINVFYGNADDDMLDILDVEVSSLSEEVSIRLAGAVNHYLTAQGKIDPIPNELFWVKQMILLFGRLIMCLLMLQCDML